MQNTPALVPSATRSLAILGAGGHGRVVADCAEASGWGRLCFFDDIAPAAGRLVWPVSGGTREILDRLTAFDGVVVGIGNNGDRLAWHRRLTELGGVMATVVHPRATISTHAVIEAGSVVLAGACVSIGARLGQAVIVNTGATVDHDCDLADGVHIAPGASLAGGVRVGERSWIGIGAVVKQGLTIGHRAVVGAGAVVLGDVPDGATVVGNPARPLDRVSPLPPEA